MKFPDLTFDETGALLVPAIRSENYPGPQSWALERDGTANLANIVLLGGTLTSDNYVAGESGFHLDGTTGNAELNDVTIRGELIAGGTEGSPSAVHIFNDPTFGGVADFEDQGGHVWRIRANQAGDLHNFVIGALSTSGGAFGMGWDSSTDRGIAQLVSDAVVITSLDGDVTHTADEDIRLVAGIDAVLEANVNVSVTGGGLVNVSAGGSLQLFAGGTQLRLDADDTSTTQIVATSGGNTTIQSVNGNVNLTAAGRVAVGGPDFSNNATRSYMAGMQQPQIASGSATVSTNGSGIATIAHGLPGTPRAVLVTIGGNHLLMMATVSSKGSSTFSVRFSRTDTGALYTSFSPIFIEWVALYYP